MNKNKNQDERVIMARRKIQSDGYQIFVFGLIASILIQEYLFKAPFSQYVVEFVLLAAVGGYVLIRNIKYGNDIFNSKIGGQAAVVLGSMVSGLTVSVFTTTLNYINYADKIKTPIIVHIALVFGITFLTGTVVAFIALQIVYLANKKKQDSIESNLNDDEDNND